jgi:hypothetical protein
LQALVAGLAGVAIGRGVADAYQAVGVAPRLIDGIWREGYIVLPAGDRTRRHEDIRLFGVREAHSPG